MVLQPRDSGPIPSEHLSSPTRNLREPSIYGHFQMRVPAVDTVTQLSESRKSTLAVAAQVRQSNRGAFCANETRRGSYLAPRPGLPGPIFWPACVHLQAAEEEQRERIKCMITDLE